MTIKECKEWLSRARKTDEEINALILEQERALTNATSTVAQSGSEKVQTSNVNKLDDATLRTLLILRYLNFQTWEMIACKMNYGYRHILRLHGNALIEIKNVIECHIEPVI